MQLWTSTPYIGLLDWHAAVHGGVCTQVHAYMHGDTNIHFRRTEEELQLPRVQVAKITLTMFASYA